MPRARLQTSDGKTTEWHSKALRTYQRRTLTADALIASAYLAGTNTRRVRRALAALFRGAVSKDIVSRVWRKIKSDWDAWNVRSLADEPIVRLILDGTVVRVRLDRKATSISLLVVIGVRVGRPEGAACGQAHGRGSRRGLAHPARRSGRARSAEAGTSHRRWRAGTGEGTRRRWDGVPVQRCTVHKLRNLVAHAPERLARRDRGRLFGHDLLGQAGEGSGGTAESLHPQVAGEVSRRSPTAWRKPAIGCSPLRSCRRANGEARARPMPSSGCTRSSNGGSRPRPCCPQQRLPPCCSGRCSLPARSTCARSMAGRRSPQAPSISQLTSPPDTITSCRWRLRHIEFQHKARRHHVSNSFPSFRSGRGSLVRAARGICCDPDHLPGELRRPSVP